MRVVAAVVVVFTVLALTLRPADAKCTLELDALPKEVEWDEPFDVHAWCWFENAWLSARYTTERPEESFSAYKHEPDAIVVSSRDVDDLYLTLRAGYVDGAPAEPRPGWLELATGFESTDVAYRYLLPVTHEGVRPPDSAYISGEVHGLEGQQGLRIAVVVWAPVGNPKEYRYTSAPWSGAYHTGFLTPGDWFVGYYETTEQTHAVGDDLITATGTSSELGRDVTLRGKVVTVSDAQPISGVEFTIERVPPPPITFPTWTPTPTPDISKLASSVSHPVAGQGNSSWFGAVLLAGGTILLASFGVVLRKVRSR